MASTNIQWCDKVWNAVTGCTPVSEGCEHCYARRMAAWLKGRCGYQAANPFAVTLHKDRLNLPLQWKSHSTVFVDSMGDLFHEQVGYDFVDAMFYVMNLARWHKFIILTKRAERGAHYLRSGADERIGRLCPHPALKLPNAPAPPLEWPLPHVLVGFSAENQARFTERWGFMSRLAARGWKVIASLEPLLEPIDLDEVAGLSGVIVGCESGPGARPMDLDWVRSLHVQCRAANMPFFFKQAMVDGRLVEFPELDGRRYMEMP